MEKNNLKRTGVIEPVLPKRIKVDTFGSDYLTICPDLKSTHFRSMFLIKHYDEEQQKAHETNANEIVKRWNEYDKLKEDNIKLFSERKLLIDMTEEIVKELHYHISTHGGTQYANTHWAITSAQTLLSNLKK